MNRILLAAVLIFISVSVEAQVRKLSQRESYGAGSFEARLNTGIGLSSIKENRPFNNYIYTGSNREIYFNLNTSIGYYIIDGLSVEPELGFNLNFDGVTAMVIGNLCYTFNNDSRSTYPFAKASYGFTDILNYANSNAGIFESLNYKVIGVGAGLKFLQTSSRAFLLEITYMYISGTDGYPAYYYVEDIQKYEEVETIMSIISISFGYSFSF